MVIISFLYLFFEFLNIFKFSFKFFNINQIFFNTKFNFTKGILNFFIIFIISFLNDRDSYILIKDFLFNWVCYILFFVLFSLIFFVSEEFSTSIFEVFFDTFFITWLIFYLPDFFIFGLKSFNNKFKIKTNKISYFFLPFIEVVSGLFKSFILCVRINTNYISGHLLISIVCLIFEFFISFYNLILLIFIKLFYLYIYFLEISVSILQIYVILLLSLTYVKDSYF